MVHDIAPHDSFGGKVTGEDAKEQKNNKLRVLRRYMSFYHRIRLVFSCCYQGHRWDVQHFLHQCTKFPFYSPLMVLFSFVLASAWKPPL